MKLGTRITLLSVALTSFTAIALGIFGTQTSLHGEIQAIDTRLEQRVLTLNKTADPLTTALSLAEISPLTLIYFDGRRITYLSKQAGQLAVPLSRSQYIAAVTHPLEDANHLRYRTIALSKSEYLLLALSASDARVRSQILKHDLTLAAIFLMLFNALISWALFRRDSKINSVANELALNNQRMQEFYNDAAHELRTPLTIIKGYNELLQQSEQSEIQAQWSETIAQQSARLRRIIDNLLILGRSEEVGSKSDSLNLSKMLQTQMDYLTNLYPERNVESQLAPNVKVVGDEEQVQILLNNIFSNILRYTQEQDPVRVSLSRAGKRALVVIEDGGPGLKSYENHAFRRFDSARSREHGGSGLGISIMAKIVANHGGEFALEKSSLGGLAVRFSLPKVNKNGGQSGD